MPVRERPFQRPRLILFAAVALLLLHLAPQLDPLRELAQVGTRGVAGFVLVGRGALVRVVGAPGVARARRSEEHTSELQSRSDLVCRLLLEKKKKHAIASKTVYV